MNKFKKMKLVLIEDVQKLERKFYTERHDFETPPEDKPEVFYKSVFNMLQSNKPEEVKMRYFTSFLNKFVDARMLGKRVNEGEINIGNIETSIAVPEYNPDCTIGEDPDLKS